MKRCLPLLLPILLSACLGRQEAMVPTASFDFSPVAMSGQGALPTVEVNLPAWLNTGALQYRLLYRDPNQLQEYAHARWAGQPSALVQQRLRLRLAGAFAAAGEACRLQVQIQEFTHSFASSERSAGELRAELRMFDSQRRVLASRPFATSQPATTANASGGVAALAEAVDQLARETGAWVREEAKLARCR